jgi:hypothetical protein
MDNLFIQETHIDRTQNVRVAEIEIYETFTDNKGVLFRSLQSEYGRCIGKAYIDQSDGTTKAVGWVFIAKRRYEHSDETYLAEVWITVHRALPTRTIEYQYA